MSRGRMHETVPIAASGSGKTERAVAYGIDLAGEGHALCVTETRQTHSPTVGLDNEEIAEHGDYGEEAVTAVGERATERGLDGKRVAKRRTVAGRISNDAEENDIGTTTTGQWVQRSTMETYPGSTPEGPPGVSSVTCWRWHGGSS